MVRFRIFMFASMGIRMGTTLATFAIIARVMGPANFGLFALIISISNIAAMMTDFGFAVKALRDIGGAPDDAGNIISRFMGVKLLLTVAVSAVAFAVLLFSHFSGSQTLFAVLVYTAVMLQSFGDLCATTFRGIRRFGLETAIVTWTSALHFVLIGVVAFVTRDSLAIAFAYFLSRLVYTVVCMRMVIITTGVRFEGFGSPRETWQTFKTSAPFALDTALSVLYGQLDILLITPLVGLHASGIYAAGQRIVQGLMPLSVALAGIQIPILARTWIKDPSHFPRAAGFALLEYIGAGALFAAVLLVAGPLLVSCVYGPQYAELTSLTPGLAAFIFMRFVASGLGVQLVTVGKIRERIAGTALTSLLTFGSFFLFLPHYGVAAAPWVMASGMTLLCVLYGRQVLAVYRSVRNLRPA